MTDPSDSELFTIGQVVALLHRELDISISHLRFWDKEGLLVPQRTPGGHRLYSMEDIERIRLIKRLQSNRNLPIATIKQMLASTGHEALSDALPYLERLIRPRHYDAGFEPLDGETLARTTRLPLETVTLLTEKGVLLPSMQRTADDRISLCYDEDDLWLCQAIVELRTLGIDLDLFIEKAALTREFLRTEWERIAMPRIETFAAIPPHSRMRLNELFEEFELLLMHKIRFRLRSETFGPPAADRSTLPEADA